MMLLPILAESLDGWGPAITSLTGNGFAIALVWYLISKEGPRRELAHETQNALQRADLLALAAKERETLERVVAIFAEARNSSDKDTNDRVKEVLDELRKDGGIKEKLAEALNELERIQCKPPAKSRRDG
jgi:signal transduction histidine kinase